jgi:hypothetical protein
MSGYFKSIKFLIDKITEADEKHTKTEENTNHHWADYNYLHEATLYSPLHWLAFHNDYKSCEYILSKIKFEIDYERWVEIMRKTRFRRLTPICIAGKKDYKKVIEVFFNFFLENSYIIKAIFSDASHRKNNLTEEFAVLRNEEYTEKIKLLKFSSDDLNEA